MSIAQSAMHLANGEKVEELDQYEPKKARKSGKKSEKTSATSTTRTPAHTHEDGETLQIREDKRNYRRHGEKNLSLIGRSLDDFGAGRSIVADNSGQVIGGNGTLREANKRGIPKRIIHTTGDELVVVVRDDIAPDDPRRQKLAIMDNSTTDTSEFEYMMLQEDFSIPELEDMGIEIPEDMLAIDDGEGTSGETEPDAVPEVEEEPVSVRGKVYQLGKHRLMCGDSTSADDVATLMNGEKADMVFTDPPYGVSYADKNRYLNALAKGNAVQVPIKNDHMSLDETGEFVYQAFCRIKENLAPRSSYYITAPQGGDLLMMMMMMMMKAEIPLRHCLIWVKNNHVLGRCDYNYKHEPILFGWVDVHDFYGKGEFKFSTWEIPKPVKNDLHPTMKPVALVVNACLNSTKENNNVLDLFGGSGSTLIACEQTNRRCRMMELDEHYCDVIRRRWAEFVHGEGCDWQSLTPEVK